MIIEARIAGIPCQVKVTYFHKQAPWRGSAHNCPSDLDYYGYTEMDYEILDRKGYKAPWLEKKISDKDTQEIERLIEEAYEDDGDY